MGWMTVGGSLPVPLSSQWEAPIRPGASPPGMVAAPLSTTETAMIPSAHLVEGRVLEARAGRSIMGAAVRVLEGDRVHRSVPTDENGYFRLELPSHLTVALEAGNLRLRVERMGYTPEERPLGPDDGAFEFALAPAPIALEGFRVEAIPAECRGDDSGGLARQLWDEARRRHPGGMDTLGVAAYMLARVDTLREPGSGNQAAAPGHMEAGQRGSAPILRMGWDRRIQRSGYAFPVRRTDRSGSYASWSYPPLEADMAPHFGTDLFGERHYFQVQDETPQGWWIRFCARDDGDPHLEGLLRIGSDTLVQEVRWQVRTPEPDEAAGGRAVFPPRDPDGDVPPLLPMESEVRANHRGTQTVTRIQWFEDWLLAPGDSVPFLPRRRATPESGGELP